MSDSSQIRVIVLGLVLDGDRLFVSEGYDDIKQESFYRALGGGIHFGETSIAALKREFREEIQAELTNIRYLGCLESLFTFNGTPGHEIVQLYRCDFIDSKFYQLEQVTVIEHSCIATATWVDINRFKSQNLKLVPAGCLNYL